jgi:hypothetical protein
MNTCSTCARRPTGARLQHRCPRGCLPWTSPAEGASGSCKAGSIDVLPTEAGSATGKGVHALLSHRPGGVRGFDRRSVRQPKKLLRSPRAARKRGAAPLDPKPATCRQARGCWRPDDREVVRRLPRTEAATSCSRRISKTNAGGFSHGARRAASEEGVFATGARDAKRRL